MAGDDARSLMRRSRRRWRWRLCGRMRRFLSLPNGMTCIRTRSTRGRSRFRTMLRACSREEGAVQATARRSASGRRPSFTPRSANGRSNGISWPGGQGDERARSKSNGRTAWRGPVRAPPMRAAGCGALGGLSAQGGAGRRRSGGDAADRRLIWNCRYYGPRRMTFELNKEGRGVNRKRVRRLMRTMGIEAGFRVPEEQSRARAQDIPLAAAGSEDCRAEPRVGGRRDLHPDGVRLPLSGGDQSTGPAGRFWRGGCRTPTMRASARRRWRRRCFGSKSRGFSILTRAPLSPPR